MTDLARKPMMEKALRQPVTFGTVMKYIFLILFCLFSVFPLYYMLVGSTNTSQAVIGGSLMPGGNLIANYEKLLMQQSVWTAMRNSFTYAVSQTVVAILVCSLAGYGFEIFHDKHKDRLMSILLLAMMVPFAATMIPLFQMFSRMGLLNTAMGFMLPAVSTPFLIMLFRQSARSFPHDMIEAARIDGLGEVGIFVRIFIPTMRSTYAAAATITFMNSWNNYLWPKVIMQTNESITMPMLIANLIAGYVTDYGMLMLAVTICTLPTIIVFFVLQKSFAEGIAGAIK